MSEIQPVSAEVMTAPASERSFFARHPVGAALAMVGLAAAGYIGYQNKGTNEEISNLQQTVAEQHEQLDFLARLSAEKINVAPETILRKNLKRPEELEGYGSRPAAADVELFKGATVKLFSKYKGQQGEYFPNCTGIKAELGGEDYVVTAAHCILSSKEGKGSTGKGGIPAGAFNYTDQSLFEYGASPGKTARQEETMAPVLAMSVSLESDWALIDIDNAHPSAAAYNNMPAVKDIENRITENAPVPGESVRVFSLPGVAEERMIAGEGVYLGRGSDPWDSYQLVDFVGLENADSVQTDACNPGASGSVAVAGSGRATGPLALYLNSGYPTDNERWTGKDGYYEQLEARLRIEDLTGVDTSDYHTICMYEAGGPALFQYLVEGFNRPFYGK